MKTKNLIAFLGILSADIGGLVYAMTHPHFPNKEYFNQQGEIHNRTYDQDGTRSYILNVYEAGDTDDGTVKIKPNFGDNSVNYDLECTLTGGKSPLNLPKVPDEELGDAVKRLITGASIYSNSLRGK